MSDNESKTPQEAGIEEFWWPGMALDDKEALAAFAGGDKLKNAGQKRYRVSDSIPEGTLPRIAAQQVSDQLNLAHVGIVDKNTGEDLSALYDSFIKYSMGTRAVRKQHQEYVDAANAAPGRDATIIGAKAPYGGVSG
jgi:hypothetical protein